MHKLKYQGGITKLIASKIAGKNKTKFAHFIKDNLKRLTEIGKDVKIPIELISFSSKNDFHEQILSILSFLRFVGTPDCWTVYSDGTHTSDQSELLKRNFEFIKFEMIDEKKIQFLMFDCKKELMPYKEFLIDYASKFPLGKRLFLYLNYEVKKTTLFIDSDILFYEQASILNTIIHENVNGWYLPEAEWGCLDSRYIKKNQKELYQVNGGFLLFNKNLEKIAEGLEFFKELDYKYEYFTEQTIMHVLLNLNNFKPLDSKKFILNSADQFDFSYLFPVSKMAIRHYTGPVRHKMWQKDWKWHLSIS